MFNPPTLVRAGIIHSHSVLKVRALKFREGEGRAVEIIMSSFGVFHGFKPLHGFKNSQQVYVATLNLPRPQK